MAKRKHKVTVRGTKKKAKMTFASISDSYSNLFCHTSHMDGVTELCVPLQRGIVIKNDIDQQSLCIYAKQKSKCLLSAVSCVLRFS